MFPRPPRSRRLCFSREYSVSLLRIHGTGEQRAGWGASGFEHRAEEESKLSSHGWRQHGHERPRRTPQHRDTHATHDAKPACPTHITHRKCKQIPPWSQRPYTHHRHYSHWGQSHHRPLYRDSPGRTSHCRVPPATSHMLMKELRHQHR